MKQYGSVIGNQARQRYGLVERILLFASSCRGRLRYELRPVDLHQAIDVALANAAGLIEAAHATVQCEIPEGLPLVVANAEALSQCLQNLITIALKYASGARRIGIRTAERTWRCA